MENRYTRTAIALHWIVAGLVLFQIAFGWYLGGVPSGVPERSIVINLHKSISVTAGVIILIRLWWRALHPAPPFPGTMPRWEARAAKWLHAALKHALVDRDAVLQRMWPSARSRMPGLP